MLSVCSIDDSPSVFLNGKCHPISLNPWYHYLVARTGGIFGAIEGALKADNASVGNPSAGKSGGGSVPGIEGKGDVYTAGKSLVVDYHNVFGDATAEEIGKLQDMIKYTAEKLPSDSVSVFAHGSEGTIYAGSAEKTLMKMDISRVGAYINSVKSKISDVYLFSCNGGTGGNLSAASQLARAMGSHTAVLSGKGYMFMIGGKPVFHDAYQAGFKWYFTGREHSLSPFY